MSADLRRQPHAVIAAHRMDPSRRELYVEGPSDRHFFVWLASASAHPNALVIEISAVDIPEGNEGGNRSRLLSFAGLVCPHIDSVRAFVDADFDRILGTIPAHPIVWLSDGRDLESYYLREDCFDKLVHLSLCTDVFSGRQLLESLSKECRLLGFLRLLSTRDSLRLPFQRTSIHRYLRFSRGVFNLDIAAYARALLSNAGLSLRLLAGILSALQAISEENHAIPDTEIIHGDDLLECIGEVLRTFHLDRGAAAALLRSTFQRDLAANYPALNEAISFISQ